VLFGGALTAITIVLISLSHWGLCGWFFAGAIIALSMVALAEYGRLCAAKGLAPAMALTYYVSCLYLALHYIAVIIPLFAPLAWLILGIGAFLTSHHFFKHQRDATANIGSTLLAFVYITLPMSWLFDINAASPRSFWILWLLAVTKGGDMAAYFCGKFCGRHSLAPSISPNKTIEGAIGGIIGSTGLSIAIACIGPHTIRPLLTWALLGLCVGVVAMAGDLFESILKRDAGVKDSNTIPGLGGVLDIVDSLLFTTPLLFLYLIMTGEIGIQ
jgi:phosphatidate cytidylyltransferase